MRCIIIEDEPLAQEILVSFVSDHPSLELLGTFDDAIKALEFLNRQSIDLIFLDINLPKLSGMSFYQSLQTRPQVIFTTAYPEHAVQGFELAATDYLLKPISFERFLQAVQKAVEKSETQNDQVLLIKSDKKYYRIPLDEISLISSMGDFAKVHTTTKTYITSQTLKQLLQILPNNQFLRIHKSYIAAIHSIEYLEGNQVKIGSDKIPVGYSYREAVDSIFRR